MLEKIFLYRKQICPIAANEMSAFVCAVQQNNKRKVKKQRTGQHGHDLTEELHVV